MRSLIIFLVIQTMSFTIALSDVRAITFIVLGAAVLIFSTAYIVAASKDRQNKRTSASTLLEVP